MIDVSSFMVLMVIMLVGFGICFYSLFAHSSCQHATNLSQTDDHSSANTTCPPPPEVTAAYGDISQTMLSMFRMLNYGAQSYRVIWRELWNYGPKTRLIKINVLLADVDPDVFLTHRFPWVVFSVFILFVSLAIIVMLNLLIAMYVISSR